MNIFTAFLVVASALSVPCANSQADESQGSQAQAQKYHRGHEHAQASRSPGKPGAAITLLSESTQSLKLLQNTKLDLVLQSHLSDGTIDVSVKADDTLELLSLPRQWSFEATEDKPISLPIAVMARSNGVHHMHIFIHHRSAEGEVTHRAFAVEFSVGVSEMQLFSKHNSTTINVHPEVVPLSAEEQVF